MSSPETRTAPAGTGQGTAATRYAAVAVRPLVAVAAAGALLGVLVHLLTRGSGALFDGAGGVVWPIASVVLAVAVVRLHLGRRDIGKASVAGAGGVGLIADAALYGAMRADVGAVFLLVSGAAMLAICVMATVAWAEGDQTKPSRSRF